MASKIQWTAHKIRIENKLILNQKVWKSKSKIALAFWYALLWRHQFSRQIRTRHNSCNSWEQNSKNNEKVHFHQGIRTVPGVPRSIKYYCYLSFYFRLLKIIKEQGQSTNNVTTSLKESKTFIVRQTHCPEVCAIPISVRDHACITSRECVSMGVAGARTRRSLGHHLLHPLILRLLVLCAPADFETQSSLL